jgi:hypothetical protein
MESMDWSYDSERFDFASYLSSTDNQASVANCH